MEKGDGTTINMPRESVAKLNNRVKYKTLFWWVMDDITLMPINFDNAYPITWTIMIATLKSMPQIESDSNKPAVNGLRIMYIEK